MAVEIRQPLDVAALQAYLVENVKDIESPISLKQFGLGESNPTYLLTSGNSQKFVVRKRPPGALLSPTAHRIDREYRILNALQRTDVPVPRSYHFCHDESVIGTTFYVMEYLDGRIFDKPSLPGVSEKERTTMWQSVVAALAKLHRVDYRAAGLSSLGKDSGFYTRQLKTFASLASSQARAVDKTTGLPVGNLANFSEMADFFAKTSHQPQDRSCLIHGDYKIDNIVFHSTEPRVIGILDWEMATIGHPISDFTNLTQPYVTARYHTYVGFNPDCGSFLPGTLAGMPTRDECVAWYRATAGFAYSDEELKWGDAFGAFRLAVVLQGIAARYVLGQSGSLKAKAYAEQRFTNAQWAFDLVVKLRDEISTSQGGRPGPWKEKL